MSRFFVGQLVRVVSASHAPEHIGRETRIASSYAGLLCDYWELEIPHPAGGGWLVVKEDAGDVLEPILPEGAAPSEYTTLADLLSSLNVEVTA